MKLEVDKKYRHLGIFYGLIALAVSCLAIAFCYLINHNYEVSEAFSKALKILAPIIDGLVIAFLLVPVVNFIERRLFPAFIRGKKRKKLIQRQHDEVEWLQNKATAEQKEEFFKKEKRKFGLIRAASIAISLIFLAFLIYAFLYTVIPQIQDSIENIVKRSGDYYANVEGYLYKMGEKHPELAANIEKNWNYYYDDIMAWRDNTLLPTIKDWLVNASGYLMKFFSAIWNVIIGLIISVYIVAGKEKFSAQFKKIIYGLFGAKHGNTFVKNLRFTNDKFSGFIVGKLVDSLIIGFITLICCYIFKFDYPVLIALIIGVTNIIPFFGPIFGAVPCLILLFMISPIKALYFLIFVLALQQFDGNILGPKILGESTGVSGIWVIVAITIFGGIWNVPGMIIGVPLFAVLYAGFKTLIESMLKKKELPKDTSEYWNLDYIDPENKKPVLHDDLYHIQKATLKSKQIDVKGFFRKMKLKKADKRKEKEEEEFIKQMIVNNTEMDSNTPDSVVKDYSENE